MCITELKRAIKTQSDPQVKAWLKELLEIKEREKRGCVVVKGEGKRLTGGALR
jgi:hypothetical protein